MTGAISPVSFVPGNSTTIQSTGPSSSMFTVTAIPSPLCYGAHRVQTSPPSSTLNVSMTSPRALPRGLKAFGEQQQVKHPHSVALDQSRRSEEHTSELQS